MFESSLCLTHTVAQQIRATAGERNILNQEFISQLPDDCLTNSLSYVMKKGFELNVEWKGGKRHHLNSVLYEFSNKPFISGVILCNKYIVEHKNCFEK